MSLAQSSSNTPDAAAVATNSALVKKLLKLRKAELAQALANFPPRDVEAALNEDLPKARAVSLSRGHVDRAERRRSFQSAKAVFNNRNSVADCTIRNRSAEGFLVETCNSLAIPQYFELRTQITEERFPVRVVWRSGGRLGLVIER